MTTLTIAIGRRLMPNTITTKPKACNAPTENPVQSIPEKEVKPKRAELLIAPTIAVGQHDLLKDQRERSCQALNRISAVAAC
jgi:hypothetical protein